MKYLGYHFLALVVFATVFLTYPARLSAQLKEGALTEEDESVFVVQRRAFNMGDKHEFTPYFATVINSKFTSHQGFALSYSYHLKETLALEAMAGWLFGSFTTMSQELQNHESLRPEDVSLKLFGVGRTLPGLPSMGSLSIQWAPIYGKIRLIPGVLGNFDFFLVAGAGFTQTQRECFGEEDNPEVQDSQRDSTNPEHICGAGQQNTIGSERAERDYFQDSIKPVGVLGGGLRFYFADWLGVRLEVRDIVYADRAGPFTRPGQAQNAMSTDIRNNFMLLVGASFLL